MELAVITLSISLIIFFAYLFSDIFKRYQIPDVLFLLVIGLILGPITNQINVNDFGVLGNVFATITLTIILFESGINIKTREILSSAPRAVLLMLLTLIFSIITIIPFGIFFFNLSLIESILVGSVVGGVSAGMSALISEKLPKFIKFEEFNLTGWEKTVFLVSSFY